MRGIAIAMAAALSVGLLGAAGPEAGAADGSRCDPDVYFELDANGFVTAYPGARCTGQDTFKAIEIKSIVSIENETTFEVETATYGNRPAGVYPGRARSVRNPEGSNSFCATVTVTWTFALSRVAESSSGRSCAVF